MLPHLFLFKRLVIVTLVVLIVAPLFVFVFPRTVKATRLLVTSSSSFIDLGESTEITIKAIDEAGNLDSSRNDVIELIVEPVSHNFTMTRLSSTRTELKNGISAVHIVGEIAEVVDVIVSWKDGQTPLKPSSVRLFIGIGEE